MGQPRLITAQLNRIQCGQQGWLQGPAFSCVIAADKKRKKKTRCKRGLYLKKKRIDWGGVLKKMKEISEHPQQSLPLSDMTKDIITNQSLIHNYFSSLIQV